MRLRSYCPASGSEVGCELSWRDGRRRARQAVQCKLVLGDEQQAAAGRGGCPGQRRAGFALEPVPARPVARARGPQATSTMILLAGQCWPQNELWLHPTPIDARKPTLLAEQVRDVIRQTNPSTFSGKRPGVPQFVALEPQLRPHTFGKEGREQLHQRPEQPRQV